MRKPMAFLALLVLAATTARAQDRSLAIKSFDSRIVVAADASIDVTETVQITFNGQWNGMYRKIPIQYRTPQGFNWSIRVENVTATIDGVPAERLETSNQAHYLQVKIWVPGAHDVTKTVVLHYTARNALRYFEDHDELYWNATGDEWDVALGRVSARVELPAGARGVRTGAFNGVYGSKATEAVITAEGNALLFGMSRDLEFREGLTVVVGWDKGLVHVPTTLDKILWFLRDNWPLTVPIPVFFLMFMLWSRRGRDPSLRPITTRYEPPTGMTPGEAGTLTDESVDMRDITATMVDLAVRGYLKIEEREKGSFLGISFGKDYTLKRTRPRDDWDALMPHERRVLAGIFRRRSDAVDLSDLTNEFYEELGGIKDGVMDRLVEKGYYQARPDRVRAGWMGAGVFLAIIFAFVGSAISARLDLTPVPFIAGGVLTGVIMLVFGYLMPARTESGTRALEEVLGYAEFLRRVDSDKYERVVKTPEMFEQGLPYAMALGVEAKWAKAFEGIYTTPPQWYGGTYPGQFSTMHFSHSLSSMTTTASSAMSSQPRSSSGSGFSGGGGGGGSSGGGGGGGGGGGF